MKYISRRLTYLIVFCCITIGSGWTQQNRIPLNDLLQKLPAQNAEEFNTIHQQILTFGEKGISELCGQLVAPGTGDDTQARYAISGLTKYLSQTQDEQNRVVFVEAIIKALDSVMDHENQVFLIHQLQVIGKHEAIDPLSRYLVEPELCEPATQALINIGLPDSSTAIRFALPNAPTTLKPVLIKAIGDLMCCAAVHELAEYSQSDELNTRLMTYYALASIGDFSAESIIQQAINSSDGYEQSQALVSYLHLADRLAEKGAQEKALEIYHDVLDSYILPEQVNHQCKALTGIVAVQGKEALPLLLRAMNRPYPAYRKVALDLSTEIPGTEVTWQWIEKAKSSSPAVRQEVLAMLGRRGDPTALSYAIFSMDDENEAVRVAAITTAAGLGGVQCLPQLISRMQISENGSELAAIKEAMLRMPGSYFTSAIASHLKHCTDPAKVVLLDVLAERQARQHLQVVLDQAQSQEPSVRIAAMRALGSVASLDDLNELASLLFAADQGREIRQMQNSILSVLQQARNNDQRVVLLTRLFDQVEEKDKAPLLKMLGEIGGDRALLAALPYLDTNDVHEQAIETVITLVCPKNDRDPGLRSALAYSALEKVVQISQDKEVIERAKNQLSTRPEPDEEGFVSLFNGKDLTGWVGDTSGYVAEDGVMVCKPGGNIFTAKEYKDFIVRFEFKLPAGGNNGLGIRAPLSGDVAYSGMEIQILDHDHPMYKNIKPYQAHGSVYGIVPAKRGYLKPVGEWNQEEVIANGRHITVKLNGTTIVDAHLDEASTPQPMDGNKHPGLKRIMGHIGFLGHGSRVEFRNIRIKELNTEPRPDNVPPPGFTALFNGEDLTNWKGLVANPVKRANMSPEQLEEAQKQADERMRQHWSIQDGVLVFDGKGDSLCTVKDYGDFEMFVDWKIEKDGDSGIYLRGSPQVQIWDRPDIGSAGLFNNQKNPSKPNVVADNPIREWNRFHIIMIDDRVTIYLNDQLVVDNVVMENYWERDKPIYPTGQIELQNHGNNLYFKNIYIKEIQRSSS